MTTNLIAQVAAMQALFLASAVEAVTPPRGQFCPDLTDREYLAWEALMIMAEQRDGHIHGRHLMQAARLFAHDHDEAVTIARVLRNTIMQRSAS